MTSIAANTVDRNFEESGYGDELSQRDQSQIIKTDTNPSPECSKSSKTRLTQLLRGLGAAAVIVSMSLFLMQGWSDGADINRFFIMLGQTLLLAAGGLGLSFLLKENKGARVFLALCIVSVTANFATLGAFVLSFFGASVDPAMYPDALHWSAGSMTSMLVSAASGLLLIPVVAFCYRVLARPFANLATGLFLACNALLLIPVREPTVVTAMAAIAVLAMLFFMPKHNTANRSALTPENWFALGSLLTPVVALLGRSWLLYEPTAVANTLVAGLAFYALRAIHIQAKPNKYIGYVMESGIIVLAFVTAWVASPVFDTWLLSVAAIPVTALISYTLLNEAARHFSSAKHIALHAANGSFSTVLIVNAVLYSGLTAAVIAIVAGCIMVMTAYRQNHMTGIRLGTLTIAVGCITAGSTLISTIDLFNWFNVACIGITTIVAASFIEKQGIKLKHYLLILLGKSQTTGV